jgi:hypothetical protein
MEKRQQRFVTKFFWLREYLPRQIHQELFATLGHETHSEDSVQYWVARFESGDRSCECTLRADRPLTNLAEPFRLARQDYPFASARVLSRHFGVCATTVKDLLARNLGLKLFIRRWVPHTPSVPQQVKRVEASIELLQILNDLEADSFDGIATGDQSRFQYLYESSAIFVKSPGDVTARTRQEIAVKETMVTIFFTNRKLLIPEYLPKGQKYNQDYFISDILPELKREKMRYERRKQGQLFSCTWTVQQVTTLGKPRENST